MDWVSILWLKKVNAEMKSPRPREALDQALMPLVRLKALPWERALVQHDGK